MVLLLEHMAYTSNIGTFREILTRSFHMVRSANSGVGHEPNR